MKKTKYTIDITSPCREIWEEMTLNSRGRYCASCEKNVIDFSNFSDEEIIRFFSKKKHSVCGRIAKHRLSKEIVLKERRMNPRFSILVASLVLAASNGVFSQTYMDEVVFRLPCTEKVAGMKQDSLPKASVANRLRGKVIDAKSGENLAFVNVYCRDKKNGVNTDFDGKFSLIIDNYQELPDSFEVMVSYVGYRSKSIWIQKQQFPVDHEILVKLEVIEQSIEIMGEIIIIKKKSPFVPPTYDEDLAIPSGEYDQD